MRMRSRSSVIRSTICAWIVTSRFEVGSSAISSRGLRARAMAMTTRWRMPPLSSCGYWRATFAASAIPTSDNMRTTSALVSREPSRVAAWMLNASCRPIRNTGLSEAVAS